MSTRERPGDRGAQDAAHLYARAADEIRRQRRSVSLSLDEAGRRGGISATQHGRLERRVIAAPSLQQLCRAARAVGLKVALQLYPDGTRPHDHGQLALLDRFAATLGVPIRNRREVALPIAGDMRAWDARISDGERVASVEAIARLDDVQETSRRIGLKQRDDPRSGVVLLLLNRTAHNRAVLARHREALRGQFPLDGAAILRDLRAGRVPAASGIVML